MQSGKANQQTDTNIVFSAKFELFATERSLKNYYSDIVKKISHGLPKQNLDQSVQTRTNFSVLEFGAGIGTLAAEYFNQNKIKPDCIEIDPEQSQLIKERGFVCHKNLNELAAKYDFIYTSNVLEHIQDDQQILKDLHSNLKPNGRIAIYVPAFMCIWSQMDDAVGHYRRYSRKELRDKVTASGFKILSCHYADSIGFLASFYLKFKKHETGSNAGKAFEKSLKFYDRVIYPLSKTLDLLGCRNFFGKNLLLIAEKS